MFLPAALFNLVYAAPCKDAFIARSKGSPSISEFSTGVEREFHSLYHNMKTNSMTALDLHRKRLKALRCDIAHVYSRQSCLCCMMRVPEKKLDCGHAFCDTCITSFGTRSPGERYAFHISSCVLCGLPHHGGSIQIVPPTAGIRVLSVDGGGIRGVVPLVFLRCLGDSLASLGCPLRDYFDFVCATSSGEFTAIRVSMAYKLNRAQGA